MAPLVSVPSPCYADPMTAAKPFTITCELGCKQVIARADTKDEAAEIAETNGAVYYGGDEGPGEWECGSCRTNRFEEGLRSIQGIQREMRMDSMMRRAEGDREAFLERADLAYDSARERGEI